MEKDKKITEDEKIEALELLKSPHLIQRHLDYFGTRYIGRKSELLLVKLATISRRFSKGLSVIIKGNSSVGKSELIRTVLKSVWPEDKEDLNKIFVGISLDEDETKKILDTVKTFK